MKLIKILEEPYETQKAYGWRVRGKFTYIPKSQVTWGGNMLTIPQWLYTKNEELFNYLAKKGKLRIIS
jgi:hypothetical protein